MEGLKGIKGLPFRLLQEAKILQPIKDRMRFTKQFGNRLMYHGSLLGYEETMRSVKEAACLMLKALGNRNSPCFL